MSLPQFLHLPEAANQLGLSEAELRQRVETGTILAGNLPNGEIVVSTDSIINKEADINTRLRSIKREDFEHLNGQPITVTEAVKKYEVAGTTIRGWMNIGYVNAANPGGYPIKLNEADIAYCVAIHAARKKRGFRTGAPLLDDDGNPYMLKHLSLSRYRRQRRQSRQLETA